MNQQNNFSGGGFISGGSQGGSGNQRREGLIHSVRPVVFKQLLGATQAHPDADWYIDGTEVGHITAVAQVVRINKQATNVAYTLDDGTGRYEARHWIVSSMRDDNEQSDRSGEIEPNSSYVRVTGALKAFNNIHYINAQHVHLVKDPHEPYFHLLDCLYTNIALERGLPNLKAPKQSGAVQQSAYMAQSHQTTNRFDRLPPFQQKIAKIIAKDDEDGHGVHIKTIARSAGVSAEELDAALEVMVINGTIFSTVDETTYKIA